MQVARAPKHEAGSDWPITRFEQVNRPVYLPMPTKPAAPAIHFSGLLCSKQRQAKKSPVKTGLRDAVCIFKSFATAHSLDRWFSLNINSGHRAHENEAQD
jgi:hypothetical protein